jgi:hypothetical protein
MKEIIFTPLYDTCPYPPLPTIKNIPKWYIDTPEYITGKRLTIDNHTPHTIKKCMPVFDAMTAGYIIFTQVDIEVSIVDGQSMFSWPSQNPIGFHPIEQAPLHPLQNGNQFPKFINSYMIKTSTGYSTLFTNLMNNQDPVFTIIPGIVDTDRYTNSVNFPFVLNDTNFEGLIPAGTPICQVIPFKRESWKMKIGSKKDFKEGMSIQEKLQTFLYNSYKRQFWTRKEYK